METPTVARAQVLAGLKPIDAQVLLAHVLRHNRAWLVAHAQDPLSHEAAEAFFGLAKRRRAGEPVAYLTGTREFWGLELAVSPAVLIPRPETELLVERALSRLPADRPTRVVDLGTGSGAIAVALASERPQASVIATDMYASALVIARANAERHGLANVTFCQGDWYRALADDEEPFDVITGNPPYVAAGDPHLRRGDLPYEPPDALQAGADGLAALRAVIAGARERLRSGGTLLVEHGYDQAEAVQGLMRKADLVEIETAHDLAGLPRVTCARRACEPADAQPRAAIDELDPEGC